MIRKRTKIIGVSVLLGMLALLVMACGKSTSTGDNDPIRIGIVNAMSGPLTLPGTLANNGFELYFANRNYQVAGRTIELLFEDTKGDAGEGLERIKRLVERERVDLLAGITSSAVAYAARDYIEQKKIPLVIMGSAGANGLTNEASSPYIFRASFTNRQVNVPFGKYAYEELGYKNVAVLAAGYVTGEEMTAGFEEGFTKSGGQVVQKMFIPLGTTDFAPYIARLELDKIDAVWANFFGADAINFVKQYDEFGLKGKKPLIGGSGLADETNVGGMGASAEGIVLPAWFASTFTEESTQQFVTAFQGRYGSTPGQNPSSAYVAAEAIALAIEQVNGNIDNLDAFMSALQKVQFQSPQGPVKFDEKQNIILNLYAVKINRVGDRYLPELIQTIAEDVDQFWQP